LRLKGIGGRWRGAREGKERATLQKSIDFTPLLPSAGPTGGLGLACPAPTISFTIWSVAARAFDILRYGLGWLLSWVLECVLESRMGNFLERDSALFR
jgi:hypothetical protein